MLITLLWAMECASNPGPVSIGFGGIGSVWFQRTVRIVVRARHLLGKTSLRELVGASVSQNHIAGLDVHGVVPTWVIGNSELSDESEDRRRSAPLSISSEEIAISGNVRRGSVWHRPRPDKITDTCILQVAQPSR